MSREREVSKDQKGSSLEGERRDEGGLGEKQHAKLAQAELVD